MGLLVVADTILLASEEFKAVRKLAEAKYCGIPIVAPRIKPATEIISATLALMEFLRIAL